MSFFIVSAPTRKKTVLRIYNWAHYLPSEVIREFEKQEKITIVYDTFDAVETLEARLLAARSGYDIVFPPLFPTVALFAKSGALSPLDLSLLPNLNNLDPFIQKKIAQVPEADRYVVPYLWGTTGLIYHKAKMARLSQYYGETPPINSWALLFSRKWAKRLASEHVIWLDSGIDVFTDFARFKGIKPHIFDDKILARLASELFQLRDFVYKFDASGVLNDLLKEEVIAAEIFSSYAHMAMYRLQAIQGKIPYVYVIPQEGAELWIDTIAIPKDAAQKKLAHKFINFLLQPHIIAKITNKTYVANAVLPSKQFLDAKIVDSTTIYPSDMTKKRLQLTSIPPRSYERLRLRYWQMIRSGLGFKATDFQRRLR